MSRSAVTAPKAGPRSPGLVRVNEFLWRVSTPAGHILGHIERTETQLGDLFVAKRLNPAAMRFVALGEFWSMDDALDCLTGL